MRLLLFSGTEILGFFAGVLVGFVGLCAVVAWLFSRPPAKPIVPTMIYLLFAFIICTVAMAIPNASVAQLLVVIALFPWSFVIGLVGGDDTSFGLLFLGAALNAAVIYAIGTFAQKRRVSNK